MSQRNTIILCSVFIAFSIHFGLYKLGVIKNPIYGCVVVFALIGSNLLYGAFYALRRGVVSVGSRASIFVYSRRSDPFRFWFYIFLFMLSGSMAFGLAIYALLHPNLH
jgi:hypothetical protein